jgi:outer membrane cobalamin receptor
MKTRCIVALFLFSVACTTLAQEAESTLDEVTVTATRVEQPTSEVPSSVTVVSSAEIEARGAKTVAEVIESTAGVTISDFGPAGAQKTATIRGSTSSQVLVLVDGVRVSTAMSGFTDLSTIPADSIDHIEILRSGASALYGSDAVGGVINIITKKKKAPLTISVENGSFLPASHVDGYGSSKTQSGPDFTSLVDSQKASFSVAPAIGDVVLRASGGFTRAANNYTFIDSSDEVRGSQNAGLLAGNGAAGINLPLLGGSLDAGFTGAYQQNGVPGPLSAPTLNASQTDARGTAVVKFSTDRFFSDALSLDATAHAEYADVGYANTDTPTDDSDSQLFTAGVDLQQKAYASDALTFVYGISSDYNRGLSTDFGTPQRLSAGAFLAPIIDLGSFSLYPSVRYDYYSDFAPGALSGSLGVSYKLSDTDSLKANLSRSYRVPSFEDLYWPSSSGVAGNPDLQPETGYSVDVGYERAAQGISYTAFAFARYVQDVILWQTGTDGIWRPTNFGAALYPGIEQELKLDFLDRFTATVSYTFLYSYTLDQGMTLADDKRLPMTPVHTLNATLGYANDGFSWSVTGRYQSLRYLAVANAQYLPDVFVVDAFVKELIAKGWSAFLSVDNLFGAQYQIISGYPMPNTSIRIGLTASF